MSYKTINTIGTGYSGASAIYEFLQQTNLFYDPFPNSQFSISYDPGGLQDLENVINNQFTINKSKEAYNNFIELINFYCKQNKGLKIGKNLTVSGKATDGIIESIESKIHNWCIGVQWHPEFLITKSDKLIIGDFVNESKKY